MAGSYYYVTRCSRSGGDGEIQISHTHTHENNIATR